MGRPGRVPQPFPDSEDALEGRSDDMEGRSDVDDPSAVRSWRRSPAWR